MTRPVYSPTNETRITGAERRITRLERRPATLIGEYEIKLFPDDVETEVGDKRFVFAIPADLDGSHLDSAEGFVSTFGSTDTVVQVRNITQGDVDMLTDPIQIDSGDVTSFVSGSSSSVNETNSRVNRGDLIALDVDAAGDGSMGLGVMLEFL